MVVLNILIFLLCLLQCSVYAETNSVSLDEVFAVMESIGPAMPVNDPDYIEGRNEPLPPTGDPPPYAPIHLEGPPVFPKTISETGSVRYVVFTNYVYQCEYQTNSASAVITEFRTVNATNYVPRYPKLLYIQPLRRESLTSSWENLGEELIFKLGDSTNGFYTAELRIE